MATSLLTRPSRDGPLADSGRRAFGGAQAGAPGTRVAHDLRGSGASRLLADGTEPGLPSADADGELWRARAAPPLRGNEPLDDPVLERVVGDDDEAPAGSQQVHRAGETALDRFELAVDRDPERLEDARRRMDPAPGAAGRDALHERRKTPPGQRAWVVALGDDRARDPPREWLLAVASEDRAELVRVQRGEELARGDPTGCVEAHIERGVRAEAEAARRVGQLVARETEVEEDPVGGREARRRDDLGDVGEARLA